MFKTNFEIAEIFIKTVQHFMRFIFGDEPEDNAIIGIVLPSFAHGERDVEQLGVVEEDVRNRNEQFVTGEANIPGRLKERPWVEL